MFFASFAFQTFIVSLSPTIQKDILWTLVPETFKSPYRFALERNFASIS